MENHRSLFRTTYRGFLIIESTRGFTVFDPRPGYQNIPLFTVGRMDDAHRDIDVLIANQ